jgi:hypothetical protein
MATFSFLSLRSKCYGVIGHLISFSTNSASQLDVLWCDGDTLGMVGSQVGVLEKIDQVGLTSLLEGKDSRALEAEIGLDVLTYFADQALEWELADQKISRLLVSADLTKSDSSRSVSVRLLGTTDLDRPA